MIETRTQKVASAAYQRVAERNELSPAERKAYGALAHKFPGMVLENGLAQATGFLLAKGRCEHKALFEDIHQILHSVGATQASNSKALHEEIIESDLQAIMLLTRHTLDASGWLKRYVQGILKVSATGDESSEDAAS